MLRRREEINSAYKSYIKETTTLGGKICKRKKLFMIFYADVFAFFTIAKNICGVSLGRISGNEVKPRRNFLRRIFCKKKIHSACFLQWTSQLLAKNIVQDEKYF